MCSKMKDFFLSEITSNHSDKRVPLSSLERVKVKGVIPYYGAQGIIDYVNDYIYNGKFLLIAEDGENLKSRKDNIARVVSGKFWVNNHAHVLAEVPKVNLDYLCYLLNITDISGYLTGSVQPKLNKSNLSKIKLKLPSIENQKKVSKILLSIDNKIENNNKINNILEELAQTLFKRWFVDFEFPNEDGKPYQSSGGQMVDSEIGMIPIEWGVISLDDVTSKVATGLNPRKNFVLGEGNNYYVTIKNMSNNNVVLDSKCDKITDDAIDVINRRSDLKKGDLLLSGIGTIGRVHLIFEEPKNWNISESVFTLRANDIVSEFFLYVLLLSINFQEYAMSNAMGSVQKGLRMKDLKSYTFALPSKDKMFEIEAIFQSLISQIKENDIENRKLSKLRDILLPKLMSGEIRVPVDKD